MRAYLERDCEGVDAAVFTGDVLYDDSERAELKAYVERWARAIAEHECAQPAERNAFERYFAESRRNRGAAKRPNFARLQDGTYADDHTQRHWWTWQMALNTAHNGATAIKPICWVGVNKQGDVTHHANARSSWAPIPVVQKRQLDIAMRNWEMWKLHAIELNARLQKYEPGSPLHLNDTSAP